MEGIIGIVRNGKFISLSVRKGEQIGLTSIRQQEAIPPYARELKLTEYEGRVIMVSGDIDGGWIYQAVVIDHAGPILTAVVEKIFGPLEYPVL